MNPPMRAVAITFYYAARDETIQTANASSHTCNSLSRIHVYEYAVTRQVKF